MDIKDFISELDTRRFGFKIAKVKDFSYGPEKILLLLKENDVKLVLTTVEAENLKLINKLESLNFFIKDIRVTYKFDLRDYKTNTVSNDLNLTFRDAHKTDVPKLEKIALESFINYGHYYADVRLDPNKCNEIYGDWIKRSCQDRTVADKVLVADDNGEIAGFLSFKIYTDNKNKYAAGGLGAVSPKYRNKDVFRMITIAGLTWGRNNALDWEQHDVLITNYPVNRSFSKLGFKISKSFATLHHWIE